MNLKVITAPHQTLRQTAKPVTQIDKKLIEFVGQLKQTLESQSDPEGVGLAAPQVDQSWRMFAIRLGVDQQQPRTSFPIQVAINPEIVTHSPNQELGPDKNEPDIEGCLSIPKIYGPVPRWQWVEVEYQQLNPDTKELIKKQQKLSDYDARVFQHELDHLNGTLFTDYLLEYDLPAYYQQNNELVELKDKSILEVY